MEHEKLPHGIGRSGVVVTALLLGLLATAGRAAGAPCLIFVHGKQTNTDTFTNWNAARNYWKSGSRDFVQTATKNFAASYYVVGYNGTNAYWDAGAAGEAEGLARIERRDDAIDDGAVAEVRQVARRVRLAAQGVEDVRRPVRPILGLARQQPRDRRRDVLGHLRRERRHRGRRRDQPRRQELVIRARLVGQSPRERLEQDDAEAEDVGRRGLALAEHLLGCHVTEAPGGARGLRAQRRRDASCVASQAEVDEHDT